MTNEVGAFKKKRLKSQDFSTAVMLTHSARRNDKVGAFGMTRIESMCRTPSLRSRMTARGRSMGFFDFANAPLRMTNEVGAFKKKRLKSQDFSASLHFARNDKVGAF
jgi:hypothetical protein